jgi:hypothetical protein
MERADVFVFFDDVQYDRRGWRNRNRVKTANGTIWLTVPVRARGSRAEGTPISDICIDWSQPWPRKHLETLRRAYSRAPLFASYLPLLENFFSRRDELLADFVIALNLALADELAITSTKYIRSSTLNVTGSKTRRILEILKLIEGTHYITGPAARSYLDESMLQQEGISVEYMTYEYPEYEQLYPPFDQHVSILDLLFMKGSEAPEFIWNRADAGGP